MKIFIAAAWPYVNGELHLGHLVGCLLPPDIFARYHRQKGNDVLIVSGSDMHGTPTEVAAEKAGIKPSELAEKFHKQHLVDFKDLGISYNLYTSTETQNHKKVVQQMFSDLLEKGLIVKKKVKQYWSKEEKKFLLDRFIEGECPHCHDKGARGDQCDKCGRTLEPTELINPHSRSGEGKLTLKDNEDFYLDLPKLQKDIEIWLNEHPHFKNWRKQVITFTKAWLKEGLKARPITRNLSYGIKLPKGVEIENVERKVIYVWIDAVIGYYSAAIEWSKRQSGDIKGKKDTIFLRYEGQASSWRDFWQNPKCRHYYFMGKDNIVFHTIIWPAMIIGWNKDRNSKERLNLPHDIAANAFLNLEGKKMSKSRNWFVSLRYLIDTYGQDLIRFYFTFRMPENRDSNFKWKDFIDVNNNELVANLGNFIHRTLSFIDTRFDGVIPNGKVENEVRFEIHDAFRETEELLENVKLSEGLQRVLKLVSFANKYFDKKKVWKVVKEDGVAAGNTLYNCIQLIEALRILLLPFLPLAMSRLTKILSQEAFEYKPKKDFWRFKKIKPGVKLQKVGVLFNKIDPKVAEEERSKLGA